MKTFYLGPLNNEEASMLDFLRERIIKECGIPEKYLVYSPDINDIIDFEDSETLSYAND